MRGARFIDSIDILAVIAQSEERWVVYQGASSHLSCQLPGTLIDIVDVDALRLVLSGGISAKENPCLGCHIDKRGFIKGVYKLFLSLLPCNDLRILSIINENFTASFQSVFDNSSLRKD